MNLASHLYWWGKNTSFYIFSEYRVTLLHIPRCWQGGISHRHPQLKFPNQPWSQDGSVGWATMSGCPEHRSQKRALETRKGRKPARLLFPALSHWPEPRILSVLSHTQAWEPAKENSKQDGVVGRSRRRDRQRDWFWWGPTLQPGLVTNAKVLTASVACSVAPAESLWTVCDSLKPPL